MISYNENTTLVGVSELRNNIEKILSETKNHKVLIEKRNKPLAVLIDIEKYNQIEKILDVLEDFALGYLASKRDKGSKLSDYIDIEEVEKMLSKK